jgi:hypothetical protein
MRKNPLLITLVDISPKKPPILFERVLSKDTI